MTLVIAVCTGSSLFSTATVSQSAHGSNAADVAPQIGSAGRARRQARPRR